MENLIPSCLWLAIVGLTVQGGRREGWKSGTAELLAQTFGQGFYGLTRAHLLAGFTVRGRRLISAKIALASIECLEWLPGQASSRAGRDMKDWFIAIRFDPGEETEGRKRAIGWGIAVVGPSRPKEEVEADGIALVDRLRAAGVSLSREENEKSRVRFVAGKCG